MPRLITLLCILLAIILCIMEASVDGAQQFIYHGFKSNDLLLVGAASITQDGILSLTNSSGFNTTGHGFYTRSLLINAGPDYGVGLTSFSTTFVFSMTPYFSSNSGDEMAFVISSTADFSGNIQEAPHNFFAIVIGVNHETPVCIAVPTLGADWNCPVNPNYEALLLSSSGKPVQLWADYNSPELNITLALLKQETALQPQLYYSFYVPTEYLWPLYSPRAIAYAGFSASAGDINGATTHQILGWSFNLSGPAQPFDYSLLQLQTPINTKRNLVKWLPAAAVSVLTAVTAAGIVLRRWHNKKTAEAQKKGLDSVLGPRRFSHKDLCKATNGFSSGQLLGKGGFGRVYVGAIDDASGGMRVAVKRVSSESKQGLPQFMAEIVILGRLRHRNLVRLIGYCRHKGELLLVYEHMPNGSLDRYLHGDSQDGTLVWSQRLHIIKGVASGLLYLHEDCEKVILHRDVKASNVLLDAEMNGRLGDFGLARLHDHGADAHTTSTHVAGTRGYLAPELLRFGKATKATDVFAFGAFILEVACGRRPMSHNAHGELLVLVDWVLLTTNSICANTPAGLWTPKEVVDQPATQQQRSVTGKTDLEIDEADVELVDGR